MFYILNLVISSVTSNYVFFDDNFRTFITPELTESYIYLVFLFDSIDKLYFIKKDKIQKIYVL